MFHISGDDDKNLKIALSLLCHLLPKKGSEDVMKYIYEQCKVSTLVCSCSIESYKYMHTYIYVLCPITCSYKYNIYILLKDDILSLFSDDR